MKIFISLVLLSLNLLANDSVCFGTTSKGKLENGVKLPSSGKNFKGYGIVPETLGRTYLHSDVAKIILAAYKSLEKDEPNKVFKYAETGFKDGGKFKPHKTHQNGLSVDFMTPVVNKEGKSVHLPTNALNRYGYDIEFDENDRYEGYRIDYDALAAHIVALHKEAMKRGFDLWRVIFDPKLQPKLFKTNHGTYLKKNIQFSKRRSWVRHDEHYHVDFKIPCRKL